MSRGLLAGTGPSGDARDFRAHSPRFQGENLTRNLGLAETLQPVADRHGLTVAQLAIAWVAGQGDDIFPLVGMRTLDRIAPALRAINEHLDAADLQEIERLVPAGSAAGDRYAREQFTQLDSERVPTR